MPRISAPTLAEHQDRQRTALLEATVDLLATEGVAAVTPGAAGRRARLARSSVYQYFDSGAALLAAAVEHVLGRVASVVAAAVAGDPTHPLDAWVGAVLVAATTRDGRALAALERAELPGPCRDRLRQLTAEIAAPLVAALSALGVERPAATAELVGGTVEAAAHQVAAGASATDVRDLVLSLLHGGITVPVGRH